MIFKTNFGYQSNERIILENALSNHNIKFDFVASIPNSVEYKAYGITAEQLSYVYNKALQQTLLNPPEKQISYKINWIKGILIVSTLLLMLVISFLAIHILAFYLAIK